MSSAPGTFEMPKRHFLSAQTADAIRKAIGDDVWRESLPSERRLGEIFQVSRPTIRTALQSLARQGLIEIRQGRRNRLIDTVPRSAAPAPRLVVLVSHQPILQTSLAAYQGISEMRAHLADHGFVTEVVVCPMRSAKAQQRKLETFLRQNPAVCCVLLSVSKELQEWFVARSIPALVLGSCHPAVRLPSLDVDYRSVCRHAAGILRGKGHRRIAFVIPNSGAAGDLVSEEGFREGCLAGKGGGICEPLVIRHGGTVANIAAKLDAVFAQPRPPTALLVAKQTHTMSVTMYLVKRGIRVPEDVSLISRDWDRLFEGTISHYRFADEAFASRLSRLIFQLVDQGHLRPEPSLIFPQYVSCGTVKPLVS